MFHRCFAESCTGLFRKDAAKHARDLQPGERIEFPVEVLPPASCKVQFVYRPNGVIGGGPSARSNRVTLEVVKPPPSPPPPPGYPPMRD